MTSRSRMIAIAADASVEQIARTIATEKLSRYPVYGASLDDVVGVLHVKDFIRNRVAAVEAEFRAIIRPIPRIAAGMSAYDLMALFKKQRVHAALVVDEFGGTRGFVTMDDLVADLIEEGDRAASDWIKALPDGAMLLDGEVTLAELHEDHGLNLYHPDVSTVAGLFLAKNGTIPKAGDRLTSNGMVLIAEDVSDMKILHVRLERISATRA